MGARSAGVFENRDNSEYHYQEIEDEQLQQVVGGADPAPPGPPREGSGGGGGQINDGPF